MILATSPGTALIRKKTSTAVAINVSTDQISRFRKCANIGGLSRVKPDLLPTPDPYRVRFFSVDARVKEKRELLVDKGNPGRVFQNQVLRLLKKAHPFVGAHAVNARIQESID